MATRLLIHSYSRNKTSHINLKCHYTDIRLLNVARLKIETNVSEALKQIDDNKFLAVLRHAAVQLKKKESDS